MLSPKIYSAHMLKIRCSHEACINMLVKMGTKTLTPFTGTMPIGSLR